MKKTTKIFATTLSVFACAATVLSTAACGSKDQVVSDGKTINVRAVKMGYGEEFVYELKSAFEAAYAEEGYKLNVLTPSSDMRGNVALTDLARGYGETGVDLYITGTITPDQVGEEGEYGVLVEDIRESVHNQKAIGFDGEEEEFTVGEKLSDGMEAFLTDSHGKLYGFAYAQSSAGLVVNTRKLAKYGVTELPVTTNEMFEIFDTIYFGANGIQNSEKSTTFPVTYVSGTNGYVNCALMTWLAQYDLAGYNEFWSMQKTVEGVKTDMLEDGYEVFNSAAVTSMLSLAYHAMDTRIAAYGSTTQTLDQAQAKIMKDKNDAVFMFNGDWMLNEVKLNYRNYLKDIEFINTPINSDLGKRLFGAGTTHNLSDEKADDVLSLAAKCADQGMTAAEIVAKVAAELSVTISEAEAQTVATARGIVYTRGIEAKAYITKDSAMKDEAALVLRMMASDDFAEMFVKTANSATPYLGENEIESDYKFVKQALDVATNPYAINITSTPYGLRSRLGLTTAIYGVSHVPSAIYNQGVSMYDGKGGVQSGASVSVYETAAKNMQKTAYDKAKEKWSEMVGKLSTAN
ncbi:MAG: hypothetical protein IJX81_01950 [Clostridia bacterium]|nr:hypothetical protein [Clostridia bacterium]